MHEAQRNGIKAELVIAAGLCGEDAIVSIPLSTCKYDLIADVNGRLLRIQVKKAFLQKARVRTQGKADRAAYVVNLTANKRAGKRYRYEVGNFDYLAVFCAQDLTYLIPVKELICGGRLLRSIHIKPYELLDPSIQFLRADSRAAAERWEPWKNNFKLI